MILVSSKYCSVRMLAAGILGFLLAGCVSGYEVTSSPAISVTRGLFAGGAFAGGFECPWILTTRGQLDLSAPNRWQLATDPVALIDNVGKVVARSGDWIEVTGPGDVVGESMCSPESPIVADEIVRLSTANGARAGEFEAVGCGVLTSLSGDLDRLDGLDASQANEQPWVLDSIEARAKASLEAISAASTAEPGDHSVLTEALPTLRKIASAISAMSRNPQSIGGLRSRIRSLLELVERTRGQFHCS